MKKFAAIFITFAMLFAFASCSGSKEAETTTLPYETDEFGDRVTTEAETSDTTATVSESALMENASAETETTETTTEATTLAAPANTAEMLAMYNNAVNNAYDKKAGFSKSRYTDNASFDMSAALNAFKSLVEKFIGIGDDNKYSETVTKGNWDSDANKAYLRKSTLTESDLTGATVRTEGKYYIVTLNIKGGNSVGNKNTKSTNAPVDKSGICVGNEDKGYYDHKTGEVIYDAIGGTYAGADIKESYKNATAVAKIDSTTGELVALSVTFDISVDIDIGIGSGTASGTTHVIYKDFKY